MILASFTVKFKDGSLFEIEAIAYSKSQAEKVVKDYCNTFPDSFEIKSVRLNGSRKIVLPSVTGVHEVKV